MTYGPVNRPSINTLLLAAAANKELSFDANRSQAYLWRGVEVDYDLADRITALVQDGLLEITDKAVDVSPVGITDAGSAELR
jgi:hypothetical protein